VVLDNMDTINNADNASFIDLEYFLPDAPLGRCRHHHAELTSVGDDHTRGGRGGGNRGVGGGGTLSKVREAQSHGNRHRGGSTENHERIRVSRAGGFIYGDYTRLSSDVQQYLPEYCDRWKQLLGVKVTKRVYQYVESLLSTWETSFSAVARRSPVASRLLSLLAFLNFDDIFLDLFSADTNPVTQAEDITNKTSH
jgi:hypothetical protein